MSKKKGKDAGAKDANWMRDTMQATEIKCFLIIDVDESRAAYERACDFVAATNLTYNWSSKVLADLGGSERARLPDMYEADYTWSQKGRILLDPPVDRVVVKLNPKVAPLAVENFVTLCLGFKGKSSNTGKPLHYKGCPFHRIVKDFVAQTGDIATQTGAGGESIWGKKFKDDLKGLKVPLNKRGLIGLCNQGKNTNTSQFFFSLGPTPKLTGNHVCFGEIVEGLEVLETIEAAAPDDSSGKPSMSVVIFDCGIVE
eukprot:m.62232 g.62232  ORF g.62232 m.62232 type:complete len:256 (+) comp23116_c0_seq1:71-838(+)